MGAVNCNDRCGLDSCGSKLEEGSPYKVQDQAVTEVDVAFMDVKDYHSAPVVEPLRPGPPIAVEGPPVIKIRKPGEEYTVTLEKKNGSSLGLDVDIMAEETALPIRAITGGLAEAWNELNPDAQIRIGDKIVEVNGERSDTTSMMAKCARAKTLSIVLKCALTGGNDEVASASGVESS